MGDRGIAFGVAAGEGDFSHLQNQAPSRGLIFLKVMRSLRQVGHSYESSAEVNNRPQLCYTATPACAFMECTGTRFKRKSSPYNRPRRPRKGVKV